MHINCEERKDMKNQNQFRILDLKGLLKIFHTLKNCCSRKRSRPIIVLITGIHGVGKSSLLGYIKKTNPEIRGVTASELIEWGKQSKEVENVQKNQIVFVAKFDEIIANSNNDDIVVVDGHLAIQNFDGEIEYVGDQVLKRIRPDLIILVTSDKNIVERNLFKRDGSETMLTDIELMQNKELEYFKCAVNDINSASYILYIKDKGSIPSLWD